jgi:hypothetical protein
LAETGLTGRRTAYTVDAANACSHAAGLDTQIEARRLEQLIAADFRFFKGYTACHDGAVSTDNYQPGAIAFIWLGDWILDRSRACPAKEQQREQRDAEPQQVSKLPRWTLQWGLPWGLLWALYWVLWGRASGSTPPLLAVHRLLALFRSPTLGSLCQLPAYDSRYKERDACFIGSTKLQAAGVNG